VIRDYYLGVDGGASRTSALVADSKGNIAAYETGSGTNFYAAGMEESRENLRVIVRKLGESVDISGIKRAFIGNAAIDYSAGDDVTAAYKSGILDCELSMRSDIYAALAGHTPGGPGCLVISGTGSAAAARDQRGRYQQFGGWGHLLGDDGSAYDIAMQGLKAVVHRFDGMGEETLLCARVMEKYRLREPYELLRIVNPGLGKQELASFSLVVKECAGEGDKVSLRILERAAEYLAELGAIAAGFAGVSAIAVYGSVLLRDRIVRECFERSFRRRVPGGVVAEPQLPPVGGAVILAMMEDGIEPGWEIVAELKRGIARVL